MMNRFPLGELLVKEMDKNYVYMVLENVDLTEIDKSRSASARPSTYTSYVIKAVGDALAKHSHLNFTVLHGWFSHRHAALDDITATVAMEYGPLVVNIPISRVDEKSLEEIQSELHTLKDSPDTAKSIKVLNILSKYVPWLVRALLHAPRLSTKLWKKHRGGLFVVTSPAKYGAPDILFPTWPWPLTIGFGVVKPRPVAINGSVEVRNTVHVTLAADRRWAAGAPVAKFAEDVRHRLESSWL